MKVFDVMKLAEAENYVVASAQFLNGEIAVRELDMTRWELMFAVRDKFAASLDEATKIISEISKKVLACYDEAHMPRSTDLEE